MSGEQFRSILMWAGMFLAANIIAVILVNLIVLGMEHYAR